MEGAIQGDLSVRKRRKVVRGVVASPLTMARLDRDARSPCGGSLPSIESNEEDAPCTKGGCKIADAILLLIGTNCRLVGIGRSILIPPFENLFQPSIWSKHSKISNIWNVRRRTRRFFILCEKKKKVCIDRGSILIPFRKFISLNTFCPFSEYSCFVRSFQIILSNIWNIHRGRYRRILWKEKRSILIPF